MKPPATFLPASPARAVNPTRMASPSTALRARKRDAFTYPLLARPNQRLKPDKNQARTPFDSCRGRRGIAERAGACVGALTPELSTDDGTVGAYCCPTSSGM